MLYASIVAKEQFRFTITVPSMFVRERILCEDFFMVLKYVIKIWLEEEILYLNQMCI